MEEYDYQTADPYLYPLLKDFAKRNRKFQTEAELELWRHLVNNQLGLHFRRQHIIYDYIADFICLRKKLIIEIDGGYHSQYEQMIRDELRTKHLEKLGFRVIRFTNEEIAGNLSQVLDTIFNIIAE